MSAISVYVLVCDHRGCSRVFTSSDKRADVTRAAAKVKGWTHVVERREHNSGPSTSADFCAEHAVEHQNKASA